MVKAGSRLFLVLLSAVAVDRLTKVWAEQTLAMHGSVPVVGPYFRLTLAYNTGVAFGLFANSRMWLLALTSLIIISLVVWLILALHRGQLPSVAAWPAGLILGGACANFADRLLDGRVTDFLDFGVGPLRWPTFNLADSFILMGVASLLLVTSWSNSLENNDGKNHTNA